MYIKIKEYSINFRKIAVLPQRIKITKCINLFKSAQANKKKNPEVINYDQKLLLQLTENDLTILSNPHFNCFLFLFIICKRN